MKLCPLKVLVAAGVEETSRPDVLDVLRCRDAIIEALGDEGFVAVPFDVRPGDTEDMVSLAQRLLDQNCDCVFNLFEGFGNAPSQESRFARLLEELEIPFTGNGKKALETCLDKDKTRRALAEQGIPTPKGLCVLYPDDPALDNLPFPLFLKPNGEDGSVGIGPDSLVRSKNELKAVLEKLLPIFSKGVIVEEFLDGPEYNAAFVGNDPFEMLAFSRISYERYPQTPPFLGYDAKWDETSPSYAVMPEVVPSISPVKAGEIHSLCERAGKALGCRGYFRVDLRERNGILYVLEVNPNPDINTDSGFVRQATHKGMDYPSLIRRLVELAAEGRGNKTAHERSRDLQLPGHGHPELCLQRR